MDEIIVNLKGNSTKRRFGTKVYKLWDRSSSTDDTRMYMAKQRTMVSRDTGNGLESWNWMKTSH
jgi:hypothetical protein